MKSRTLPIVALLSFLLVQAVQSQTNSQADKSWPQFYKSFQDAVNKRDKVALKNMLPAKITTESDGSFTRDEWIKYIEKPAMWDFIKKEASSNAKRRGRNQRVTSYGKAHGEVESLVFEFGKDGKWRWVGILNE